MVLKVEPTVISRPSAHVVKSNVILYSFYVCPFVQRASIALRLKNVAFKEVFIPSSTGKKPEWLLELNPKGKVPVLQHDGHTLVESEMIVDYINEAFPNSENNNTSNYSSSLYPDDPFGKYTVRLFISWIRDNYISSFYSLLAAQESNEAMLRKKYEHFLKVNKDLNDFLVRHRRGEPFLMGNELCAGDVMIAPFIQRAVMLLTYYRHFELPESKSFEAVKNYITAIVSHPVVQDTAIGAEDMIKLYYDYSLGAMMGNPTARDNGLGGISSFDSDASPPETRELPPRPPRPSFLSPKK